MRCGLPPAVGGSNGGFLKVGEDTVHSLTSVLHCGYISVESWIELDSVLFVFLYLAIITYIAQFVCMVHEIIFRIVVLG